MSEKLIENLFRISNNIVPSTLVNYLVNIQETKKKAIEQAFYFPFEIHKYYEIAIQLSGKSIIEIDNSIYQLNKDQIMIIGKNKEHRLGINTNKNDDCTMLWVNISNDIVRTGISTYQKATRHKKWALDMRAPGAYLIKEILKELELNQNSDEPVAKYLSAFIMMIARKISFAGNIYAQDTKAQKIKTVKKYIEKHLTEPILIEDLGRITSTSPNYLCTLFKQIEGNTIINYIQNARIQLSTQLLLDTKKTTSEIAENIGFYDQFYFSKVFKRFMGMSPSEYRKTYLTKKDNSTLLSS